MEYLNHITPYSISPIKLGNLSMSFNPGKSFRIKLTSIRKSDDSNYGVEILEAIDPEFKISNLALQNAVIGRDYTAVITGYAPNKGAFFGHTVGSKKTQYNIITQIVAPNIPISIGSTVKVRLVEKVFDRKNEAYYGRVDVLWVLKQ